MFRTIYMMETKKQYRFSQGTEIYFWKVTTLYLAKPFRLSCRERQSQSRRCHHFAFILERHVLSKRELLANKSTDGPRYRRRNYALELSQGLYDSICPPQQGRRRNGKIIPATPKGRAPVCSGSFSSVQQGWQTQSIIPRILTKH